MIANQSEELFAKFGALIDAAPAGPAPLVNAATPGVPVMSSLQIAEITGKNHPDVMRDIRNTLEQAGIGLSKFASSYHNAQNKEQPCYLLPRRECDLVISGYSVKYRLAIIDRWQELEAKQSFQIPQNLPDALRLAANLAEKNAQQAAQLAIATPKAEALDRLALADGSVCITEAAKLLQLRPKDLFRKLQQHAWIFRRGGAWNAYSNRLQQGYMEAKVTTVERSDGTERVCEQVRVTAKGLARLSELTEKNFA